MAQQTVSPSDLDPASVMKLYLAAIETWEKNYESFTKAMAEASSSTAAPPIAESAQDLPAQLFQKVIEAEMELCRFYEKRWSEYLKLPQAIASCKSAIDLAELENSFYSRFTTDYASEGSKLFRSFTELVSHSAVKNA
ncbi:MAG: hypothetical protein WBX25_34510 [Rhodomicrobium sp.]